MTKGTLDNGFEFAIDENRIDDNKKFTEVLAEKAEKFHCFALDKRTVSQ